MQILSGQRALVTGGGVRVGRGLALALAAAGADVVVHYGRSEEGARATAGEIAQLGRRAAVVQGDLSTIEGTLAVADRSLDAFGGLEILVNSASYWVAGETFTAPNGLLLETPENFDLTMNVNLRAPFFLIQRLAPALAASGRGSIVNILDQCCTEPYLDRASHTLSKSGLKALTSLAARTLAPDVRVNALELGAILPPEGLSDREHRKRVWGGVDQVANALLFVLTTPFVNGETIGVKGDYHLRRR